MSFSERLRSLMTRAGLTASSLARKLGVSRQSVAFWLSERNLPSEPLMDKLATLFQVSAVWLKTGNDDIKLQPVSSVHQEDSESSNYIFIPEYELEFSCGSGDEPPEWIETSGGAAYKPEFFHKRHISAKHCKRVKADGNSMEPLICNGDTVMFVEMKEGEPIRDGHVYAMSYGGSLKIKRLYRKANGDLIIRSDNTSFEDEIVPNAEIDTLVRIYGRVIERSGSID